MFGARQFDRQMNEIYDFLPITERAKSTHNLLLLGSSSTVFTLQPSEPTPQVLKM
jgi:hypothetical protein